MARVGKIARLPLPIKEELNKRLLESQQASKILPWLNGLPEVREVLEQDFEGLHVTDQNLSEWRKGGFQEWLRRRERIAGTQELAKFSMEMAKAGGVQVSDGVAAMMAGQILTVLETVADGEQMDLDAIDKLTAALARVRSGDHRVVRNKQMDTRLEQNAEVIEMDRHKEQRTSCKLFLEWMRNTKAVEIAAGPDTHEAKIEKLGQLMFGTDWE